MRGDEGDGQAGTSIGGGGHRAASGTGPVAGGEARPESATRAANKTDAHRRHPLRRAGSAQGARRGGPRAERPRGTGEGAGGGGCVARRDDAGGRPPRDTAADVYAGGGSGGRG